MRLLRLLCLCAPIGLSACANTSGTTVGHSSKAQQAAIHQCKNELGVPGAYATGTTLFGTRSVQVKILPRYQVSRDDARNINACALAKLADPNTDTSGLLAGSSEIQPTTIGRDAAYVVSAGCGAKTSVLYGGASYCVK